MTGSEAATLSDLMRMMLNGTADEPPRVAMIVTVGQKFAAVTPGQYVDVPSAGGLHLVRDVWHNEDRTIRLTLEPIVALAPSDIMERA